MQAVSGSSHYVVDNVALQYTSVKRSGISKTGSHGSCFASLQLTLGHSLMSRQQILMVSVDINATRGVASKGNNVHS